MTAEMDARGDAGRALSLRARYDGIVATEFAAQPLSPGGVPLAAADLAGLPGPVRRYIERSGAVGRPRPQNLRVVLDANMYRKPGQAPMRARSVQYSFFGRPTRLFLLSPHGRTVHLWGVHDALDPVRRVRARAGLIPALLTVPLLDDVALFAHHS